MGNKKNLILVGVILLFAVGSAMVLYNGFGNTGVIVESDPDIDANQKEIVKLLPYGEKLDFGVLKKWNESAKIVEYEPLRPEEVGVDVNSMIAPSFGSGQTGQQTQGFLENPTPIRAQRSGG